VYTIDSAAPAGPVEAVEPVEPEKLATVRVGLFGFGRVGQAVASLLEGERAKLAAAGLRVEIAGALVRDRAKPRGGPPLDLSERASDLFDRRLDVAIEMMGGVHPAFEYVRHALEAGIPVVTANKTLMAEMGNELEGIAAEYGVPLAYDAAVLAGVPFLGALARRPFIAAPRRITGILNGTSHFIACALADGAPFERVLAEAVARGYAEPDSSADISGRDAAEKLTIVAHLAGCRDLVVQDVTRLGLDALTPADFRAARALGGVIKPVATASLDDGASGAWVGPALLDSHHPAASSRGVFNFIELRRAIAGGEIPVTFAGPGAGPDITAATIVDDVAEVVSARYRAAVLAPAAQAATAVRAGALRQPAPGPWFVCLRQTALAIAHVIEHFAVERVPAVRIEHGGDFVGIRTASASWSAVRGVAETLEAVGGDVLVLPVIEA
jgi:homoserine dehydrogenase